jgi:hypothetical protein
MNSVVEPEPELEPHEAGTFGRSRSWSQYTEVSAPAPGQPILVYQIIVQYILNRIKSELSQYSFLKVMKNLLFHLKTFKTGTHKA